MNVDITVPANAGAQRLSP